jgi:quercetin dioxygenase-like cupin family protein
MSHASARDEKMQPLVQPMNEASIVHGSRDWVEYRVFDVEAASAGLLSTQIKRTSRSLQEETGWHYHECQFLWEWVLKGWIDIQFEDGSERRIHEGSVLFLPGGCPHNEIATSEGVEMLEVCMPPGGKFVPVALPPIWRERSSLSE